MFAKLILYMPIWISSRHSSRHCSRLAPSDAAVFRLTRRPTSIGSDCASAMNASTDRCSAACSEFDGVPPGVAGGALPSGSAGLRDRGAR